MRQRGGRLELQARATAGGDIAGRIRGGKLNLRDMERARLEENEK